MPHNWKFLEARRASNRWECKNCGVTLDLTRGYEPDPVKVYTIAYGSYTCEEIIARKVEDA